jgi:hypothetical protein
MKVWEADRARCRIPTLLAREIYLWSHRSPATSRCNSLDVNPVGLDRLQPEPERWTLVSSAVVRQPVGAFSTLTSLRKRGRTFQITVRGVARPRAQQVGSNGLRGGAMAQRMPDATGFCPTFCGMMPDRTVTMVWHFLHWPNQALSWTRSYADLRCYPLRAH